MIRRTFLGILPLSSYTGTDFWRAKTRFLADYPGYHMRRKLNAAYDTGEAVWHGLTRITVH